MSRKTTGTDLTRREFVTTVGLAGLAGLAVAGAGAAAVMAAPGPPAGAAQAGTMPKRKLGKTGVDVSILALGGMFDTINNQLLLRQALKSGVNYWDTAESYGDSLSEEGYGRFFSRNPEARKEIFLVTKIHPQSSNLAKSLDESLKRLQTSYVDALFIPHGLSNISELTPAIRDFAEEMKKAGKIKFFGFSTHANMEDNLLGAAKLDWVDLVMFAYNFRVMHNPKMQEAIKTAAQAGIGLVGMKSQAGMPGKHEVGGPVKEEMIQSFLQRGFTDKQAKLKIIWETPEIASLCVQMPNLTILAADVAAARDLTKLTRKEMDSLRRYALETKSEYCAGCGKICQEAVGGAVPVNEVMRCLMYYREYGEPELARLTFARLHPEVRQRLGKVDYSRAEQACPQGLAIGELMRQARELLA